MRVIQIRKKSGKMRTIYVPSKEEKKALKARLSSIAQKAEKACPKEVAHGFMEGKNPITNALPHANKQYTTCFDLEDFFDSVSFAHVAGLLSEEDLQACFVDGAPRQGLPTSPAIANLAASVLDHAILWWKDRNNLDFVYTRYADDLSFSYDDLALKEHILQTIPLIVEMRKFKINANKTRTQCARHGRRIITGVGVDTEVHPLRKHKRMLRAATHQENKPQAQGLSGWVKYITEKRYEKTEMDELVCAIFGENLRVDRSRAEFNGEGGFRLL